MKTWHHVVRVAALTVVVAGCAGQAKSVSVRSQPNGSTTGAPVVSPAAQPIAEIQNFIKVTKIDPLVAQLPGYQLVHASSVTDSASDYAIDEWFTSTADNHDVHVWQSVDTKIDALKGAPSYDSQSVGQAGTLWKSGAIANTNRRFARATIGNLVVEIDTQGSLDDLITDGNTLVPATTAIPSLSTGIQ
jgi:hypothetical protein